MRSTDLTTKILDFDRPALKCHHEARLELVLSAAKLRIGDVGVEQQAQLVHKVGEDMRRSIALTPTRGNEGGEETEEGGVGVDVMEGCTVVNLREVVEDMGVQP